MQAFWQVLGDLAAIATVVAAVWLSQRVHAAIDGLAGFGVQIEDAGSGFSTTLSDAGRALGEVPFVGSSIAQPFQDASGSADDLAAAGETLQGAVHALAAVVSTAMWLLPVLLLLVVWLVPRLRFATRAGASRRLATTKAGRDLLAMRAVVGQPLSRVLAATPDPLAAVRNGDDAALDALARLELRSAGVRQRTAADGA